MPPTVEQLQHTYRSFSDEDLARLDGDRSSLTDEAQLALDSELRARGLTGTTLIEAKNEVKQIQKENELQTGTLFLFRGFGRRILGKKDYEKNELAGTEQFTTTVWIVLGWIPVIPTGTFRISRPCASFWDNNNDKLVVLERSPIDWSQASMTVAKTIAIILAIFYGVPLLARLLR